MLVFRAWWMRAKHAGAGAREDAWRRWRARNCASRRARSTRGSRWRSTPGGCGGRGRRRWEAAARGAEGGDARVAGGVAARRRRRARNVWERDGAPRLIGWRRVLGAVAARAQHVDASRRAGDSISRRLHTLREALRACAPSRTARVARVAFTRGGGGGGPAGAVRASRAARARALCAATRAFALRRRVGILRAAARVFRRRARRRRRASSASERFWRSKGRARRARLARRRAAARVAQSRLRLVARRGGSRSAPHSSFGGARHRARRVAARTAPGAPRVCAVPGAGVLPGVARRRGGARAARNARRSRRRAPRDAGARAARRDVSCGVARVRLERARDRVAVSRQAAPRRALLRAARLDGVRDGDGVERLLEARLRRQFRRRRGVAFSRWRSARRRARSAASPSTPRDACGDASCCVRGSRCGTRRAGGASGKARRGASAAGGAPLRVARRAARRVALARSAPSARRALAPALGACLAGGARCGDALAVWAAGPYSRATRARRWAPRRDAPPRPGSAPPPPRGARRRRARDWRALEARRETALRGVQESRCVAPGRAGHARVVPPRGRRRAGATTSRSCVRCASRRVVRGWAARGRHRNLPAAFARRLQGRRRAKGALLRRLARRRAPRRDAARRERGAGARRARRAAPAGAPREYVPGAAGVVARAAAAARWPPPGVSSRSASSPGGASPAMSSSAVPRASARRGARSARAASRRRGARRARSARARARACSRGAGCLGRGDVRRVSAAFAAWRVGAARAPRARRRGPSPARVTRSSRGASPRRHAPASARGWRARARAAGPRLWRSASASGIIAATRGASWREQWHSRETTPRVAVRCPPGAPTPRGARARSRRGATARLAPSVRKPAVRGQGARRGDHRAPRRRSSATGVVRLARRGARRRHRRSRAWRAHHRDRGHGGVRLWRGWWGPRRARAAVAARTSMALGRSTGLPARPTRTWRAWRTVRRAPLIAAAETRVTARASCRLGQRASASRREVPACAPESATTARPARAVAESGARARTRASSRTPRSAIGAASP